MHSLRLATVAGEPLERKGAGRVRQSPARPAITVVHVSIWSDLRGFVRMLRRDLPRQARAPTSLARTLRDSAHVRGLRGFLPRAGTEQQHEIVADAHERYDASFNEAR